MSVIPITCDNCGAKYKLPPTFKATQAKCQKCGSVIDVATQRKAAGDGDSPTADAKPAAAAKPAVDRSKGRAAGGSKRTPAASKADRPARDGSSRSRRGDEDDDGEDSPRRAREKKKDNTPMIIGGVGLVAIIVVVVVMMMMDGNDEKEGEETAQSNEAGKTADANANKEAPKPGDTEGANKPEEGTGPEEGGKPTEGTKPDGGSKPAEGDVKKPDTPKPTPAEAGAPAVKKEPWQKQKNPPQTMGEVRSAAEMYGEVVWPDSIDAAKKAEIMDIVGDLSVTGGIRSIRAKAKLVKAGYAGLFGILEALQKLDYKQPGDGAFGFELNKALEDITGGLNARYAAVQADENMHPAKALWNTKTVGAWMRVFAKWPDEASFRKTKSDRAKKRKG
ncbi:MAG TPA: hypothetical protein EYP98_16955 [Planctomycetes bacterium]|nr:hypothetical protein [Planctomycetota bacterium]